MNGEESPPKLQRRKAKGYGEFRIRHQEAPYRKAWSFTHSLKKAGLLPQSLGDMAVNMVECQDFAQYTGALLIFN